MSDGISDGISDDRGEGPFEQPAYKVGYGQPPLEHRFKKGRSGNPKGRPKGSKNIKTMLENLLTARQTIRENGRKTSVQHIEIVLKQLLAKALKGDLKATHSLLELAARYDVLGDEPQTGATVIGAEDEALIRLYLQRVTASNGEEAPS